MRWSAGAKASGVYTDSLATAVAATASSLGRASVAAAFAANSARPQRCHTIAGPEAPSGTPARQEHDLEPPVTSTDRRRSRRRLALVGLAVAAVALALLAAGLVYLFGRSTPPPVALADGGAPSASLTASAPGRPSAGATPLAATVPEDSGDPADSGTPADPTATPTSPTDDLSGRWSVDPSIGSIEDFTGSFVGYRVQEELANLGAATAVGRTADVTGSLTLEGTAVTSVEMEADLTTLRSDSSMRDGQLGRQGLETDTWPTATFELTEPIELGETPAEGQTFSATTIGDLTLHGVTQRVELPIEARLEGGVVTVVGSLEIAFADYGMTPPESMRVLSIDDRGIMEFQLHFTKD